jgi:hypothetical protein
MLKGRLITTLGLATVCLLGNTRTANAQNVTSGSISGTVTDQTGAPVQSAQIQITNTQTGVTVNATARDAGRYSAQGLEVGGPYTVSVRRIGFTPMTRTGILVTLSQSTRVDFQLASQAAVLTGVKIEGSLGSVISPTKTGTGTVISGEQLSSLPTLSHNFTDFVGIVPQVSNTTSYSSGGGVNIRQNAIQIDGAAAGDLFGLGATGQPGSQANAKAIPLDAVKEYQVLLAPYDVRQGNFGGALINAVTKSGTNEFHGSAYGYNRSQNMTRQQFYLPDYSEKNYGFAVGGPIVKNHAFFYFNSEWRKTSQPAAGPYIGSPDAPVNQATIDNFNSTLSSSYGFANGGSGGQVTKQNPATNVFGRVDIYLPFATRLVLRHNYSFANNTSFGRGAATSTSPNFGLTSNAYQFTSKTNSSVAEFLSNFSNGMFNELLLNYTKTADFRTVPALFPQVTVRNVPRTDGGTGTVSLVAGTEASSQGNVLNQRTFEVTENFTVPVGAHRFTVGTKDQFYRPYNLFGQNSRGSWTFNSLTDFQSGKASAYAVSAPSPSDPAAGIATFEANMFAYYLQDVWQTTDKLALTFGVRWDQPHFDQTPPSNPSVLADYGRNTATVPSKGQFSPRLAFNWDVTGDQRNQLRGGIGYFTGPPPFVYLSNAFGNSGLSGYPALNCNGSTSSTTSFIPPAFNSANIANPPTACLPSGTKPGGTLAFGSSINTIDPNFKFPQYQKISAAYDHRFANGMISTIEGLYTKSINDAFYTNLALAGPQGTDSHGRVLYGNPTATGWTPVTHGSRTQVLDLGNSSGNYTYSITGTLQKTFSTVFDGSLSYTYSQSRDVASITSSTAGSNYRYARDVTGNLNDFSLTRSKNDMPHRIIATGTYHAKTLTDLTVVYQGNSGAPYDYVYGAGGGSGSGDLNGDGNSQNDLVYVPKDVRDPNEILFTGYNDATKAASVASQQAALDKFINSVPCLRENRGKMLSRNLCRNPWSNEVDVSLTQSLQAFHTQNVSLRLDVLNFGNLINPKWGRQFFSDQGATCGSICSATVLMTQTGNKLGTTVNGVNSTQGVYTFDSTLRPYSAQNASSNYRMQLSLRYNF